MKAMTHKIKQITHCLLYYILIIFISYTFMNKTLIFDDFLINIAKAGLFSNWMVYIVAYTAVCFESVAILLLIFKKKMGLYFTLIMLASFTLYILLLFMLDRYEVCGCGGILNGMSFNHHFTINILLIFITFYLIKELKTQKDEV